MLDPAPVTVAAEPSAAAGVVAGAVEEVLVLLVVAVQAARARTMITTPVPRVPVRVRGVVW